MALEFSIVSGALPPGLIGTTVGNSFVISGTPTTAGNFTFRLRVERDDGSFAEKDYTLNALAIAAGSLPGGTIGQSYSATPTLTGDPAGTLTWSASGLPDGLTIDPDTGEISGTPSATGDFSFSVTASDSLGCIAEVEGGGTVDIEIVSSGACVINNPSDLGDFPYEDLGSVQFTQTGLSGDLQWSTSGSFPYQQFINSSTGQWFFDFQSIGGYVGPHTFNIHVAEVADLDNKCQKEVTIHIDCPVESSTGGDTPTPLSFFTEIGLLQWQNGVANSNGSISMAGGDGTINVTVNSPDNSGQQISYCALCNRVPGYEMQYSISGTAVFSAGTVDPNSAATVGIFINDPTGALVLSDVDFVTDTGNINLVGTFNIDSFTFYQIRVVGSIVLDGVDVGIDASMDVTVELRPLEPPP